MAVLASAARLVFGGTNVIIGGGSLAEVLLMEPASGGICLRRRISMPVWGVVAGLYITTHSGGVPWSELRHNVSSCIPKERGLIVSWIVSVKGGVRGWPRIFVA